MDTMDKNRNGKRLEKRMGTTGPMETARFGGLQSKLQKNLVNQSLLQKVPTMQCDKSVVHTPKEVKAGTYEALKCPKIVKQSDLPKIMTDGSEKLQLVRLLLLRDDNKSVEKGDSEKLIDEVQVEAHIVKQSVADSQQAKEAAKSQHFSTDLNNLKNLAEEDKICNNDPNCDGQKTKKTTASHKKIVTEDVGKKVNILQQIEADKLLMAKCQKNDYEKKQHAKDENLMAREPWAKKQSTEQENMKEWEQNMKECSDKMKEWEHTVMLPKKNLEDEKNVLNQNVRNLNQREKNNHEGKIDNSMQNVARNSQFSNVDQSKHPDGNDVNSKDTHTIDRKSDVSDDGNDGGSYNDGQVHHSDAICDDNYIDKHNLLDQHKDDNKEYNDEGTCKFSTYNDGHNVMDYRCSAKHNISDKHNRDSMEKYNDRQNGISDKRSDGNKCSYEQIWIADKRSDGCCTKTDWSFHLHADNGDGNNDEKTLQYPDEYCDDCGDGRSSSHHVNHEDSWSGDCKAVYKLFNGRHSSGRQYGSKTGESKVKFIMVV